MFFHWLRSLRRTLGLSASPSRRGRSARRQRPHRLWLEALEDRTVPTFIPAPGSPINLGAGFSPNSVVAADLNGDGKIDFVVGNGTQPGALSVQVGQGDGTFQNAGTLTIGSAAIGFIRDVEAADLDGDGKLDLIAAAFNGSSVVIAQNTTALPGAAPTFAVQSAISVGNGPFWVTVADLDGDGKLDLAVANFQGNSVNVLRNTSTGPGNISFAAPVTISIPGGGCRSVVAADFDNDGRLDLATANFSNASLSILQNSSTGPGSISFGAPAAVAIAGSAPMALAVGDYNGDHRPDLAVASFNTAGKVYILLNQNGSFSSSTSVTIPGMPIDIAMTDYNGDGNLDLAVASFSSTLAVLYGNGAGGFSSPENYTVGASPRWVSQGDFNGDGAPDLVVASSGTTAVTVLLNQAAASVLQVTPSTTTLNAGDTFTVTVTAQASGVPYVNYVGTVTLTSDDPLAPTLGSHTFIPADHGTYTFTVSLPSAGLHIITANGATISGTTQVSALNNPPALSNVHFTAATINQGDIATLSGNITDPDPGNTFTLVINWGDGSTLQTFHYAAGTTTFSETHTYLTPGAYPVSLTLGDNDHSGGVFYGSDTAGHLYSFDVASGAATLVGSLPGSSATEIAYDNFGNRAWLQYGANLFQGQQFNISTGAAIGGVIGNDTAENYNALAFDGATLYASGSTMGGTAPSDLRILDPVTGHSTLIGMTGINGPLSGLAFDPSTGILYGIRGGNVTTNNLVSINLATGAATVLFSTGFSAGSLGFGPDGQMYAGTNTGQLYRINLTTHAITLIGATGAGAVLSGLAVFDTVLKATANVTATINDVPPTLTLSGLASVNEAATYTLNLASSDVGPETITSWTITWGDGSIPQVITGNPPTATHIYADGPHSYTISATATDPNGTYSAGNTVAVTVNNVKPVAAITGAPATSPEGTQINLGSTITDVSAIDQAAGFTYAWTVTKDGAAFGSGTGASFSFTPNDNGSYQVSLKATDKDGSVSSTTLATIMVTNVAPTATFTNSGRVVSFAPVTVSLTNAFDPSTADTTAGFRYSFALSPDGLAASYGAASSQASATFTFDHAGAYTIYARIFDKDNAASGVLSSAPEFVGWANNVIELVRGPQDIANPSGPVASAGTGASALGVADSTGIVSLGDGGHITLSFAQPIINGPGGDFAVFENGFRSAGLVFGELAFVEVSSNGNDFFRFPSVSLTQTTTPVGSFGALDPMQIHNLAGQFPALEGTLFDLQDLVGVSPLLDVNAITQVRVVDVVGSLNPAFATHDSLGNPINDPYPTAFASGGFDLDAVGVLHTSAQASTLVLVGARDYTTSVVIDNAPPTVNAGGPYSMTEGGSLTLSASATDLDSDTLSYSWDINDDGIYGDATGANPTLNWTQLQVAGIGNSSAYNVRVQVDDGQGNVVTSAPVSLSVSNAPPYADHGIDANDPSFIEWANGVNSLVRGPQDISNPGAGSASYGTNDNALGTPDGDLFDSQTHVVSLGDGGSITVTFQNPIRDGAGADFAVFENGFEFNGGVYAELGFVEVSSDGVNFFRFPSISRTQTTTQLGFDAIDPTLISNLAGQFPALQGTPFDLQALAGVSPLLNINAVTHVRIVDAVGSIDPLYAQLDSLGNPVNDPWPTPFASGGFDLDAIGVLHAAPSIIGAATANEGAAYTLGLSSGDGGGVISNWTITWGDGSAPQVVSGNPSSVTHTFADGANSYNIIASITDENGTHTVGNSIAVTVNNVAPTLTISGLATVNAGAIYTLSLSSSDPGLDTVSKWMITWGDGQVQDVTGNPTSVTHTYASGPNNFSISATATDEDGTFSASDSVAVNVTNIAKPVVSIVGSNSASEGVAYTLSLMGKSAVGHPIKNWTITWGDGTLPQVVNDNPASVPHVFASGPLSVVIHATATDDIGTYNSTNSVPVDVKHVAPALTLSGASTIDEGATYTLSLGAVISGGHAVNHWTITWGDSSAPETVSGSAASVTHIFAIGPNTRTISATATDDVDTFAAGNKVTVAVKHVAPVVSISGAASADEGVAYTLSLTGVTAPGHIIKSWAVKWGDGTPAEIFGGNPSTVSHVYKDGIKSVVIAAVATDDVATFAASTTVLLTVNNVAPTLGISGNASVSELTPYRLNLAHSDPGADTLKSWTIVWGDGTAPQTVKGSLAFVNHTYAVGPNTYTIMATAADEDGAYVAGNSQVVNVTHLTPTLKISGLSSAIEGTMYKLSLSAKDTHPISQWAINWGDGTTPQVVSGNPTAVAHVFASGPNIYAIKATATDNLGTYNALKSIDVSVIHVAPKVTLSGPGIVAEGADYHLNLSGIVSGGHAISQWAINWGDGTAPEAVLGNPTSATHVFAIGPKTYKITAAATDDVGTFPAAGSIFVKVTHVAPTVSISGLAEVNEGSTYTLDLNGLATPGHPITQWAVKWGDGGPAQIVSGNPATTTHIYKDGLNHYKIFATATDNVGSYTASNSVAVTVDNVAPTLTLSGASTVNEGDTYTLHLASSDPGQDTIKKWMVITWGDGTAPQTVMGNPSTITHVYAKGVNDYTIVAAATDEDGTYGAGNTVSVHVLHKAPSISISGPNTVAVQTPYVLNLHGVDTHSIMSWTINWGDGTPPQIMSGNPASVTHTYTVQSTYVITAQATDDENTYNSSNTKSVTVQ